MEIKEPVPASLRVISTIIMHWNKYSIDKDYQRAEGAWSKKQEQYFIDSILRGFCIPIIFLHKKDGKKWIVDGQHRLATIKRFFDGKLELSEEYSQDIIKWSDGGRKHDDLREDFQNQFANYPLSVVELGEDYNDEDIRSMFKRLQSGTQLSVGEKLNAYPGSIVSIMRKLGKRKFFIDIIPFGMNRYLNYKMAATFLYLEKIGISDLNVQEVYDFFEKYKDLNEDSKEFQVVNKVPNTLEKIFNKNTPELKNQAWAVSVYLFLSHLIRENYNISDKNKEIKEFLITFYRKVQDSDKNFDKELIDFERETSRGTTGKKSIEFRHAILLDRFFSENEVDMRDEQRFFSNDKKIEIYRRDEESCQICNKKLDFGDESTHYHHKKLWSKSGKSDVENGVLVCSECHLKKIHGKNL